MSGNEVTIKVTGYDTDCINERIARCIIADLGIDVQSEIEKQISDHIDSFLSDKVSDEMTRVVHDAMSQGVIVSEAWEEEVDRKPVADVVRQAASEWMTKKTNEFGNRGKTAFEKIAEEIITKELEKEVREILKTVKAEAINEAKKKIAVIVADNLFDKKALPF